MNPSESCRVRYRADPKVEVPRRASKSMCLEVLQRSPEEVGGQWRNDGVIIDVKKLRRVKVTDLLMVNFLRPRNRTSGH